MDDTMFEPTTAVETVVYAADGTWIDLDPTQGCTPAFDLKDGEEVEVIIRRKVSPSVLRTMKIDKK